jgi:head-tail adaptor
MILDSGIATVYQKVNTAAAGAMPVYEDQQIHCSSYAELSFETSPARPTGNREEVQTDARIRILQNRQITNHDRVVLQAFTGDPGGTFEVTRAYHGSDPESGELITDLSLIRIEP